MKYVLANILNGGKLHASVVPPISTVDIIGFWNLSDLTESSGTGLDLTNNNGVTFAAGKIEDGAVFDGSNSLNASPIGISLDNGGVTISLWVKAPLNAGVQISIGFSVGDNAVYVGWLGDGNVFADLGHGVNAYSDVPNGSLYDNEWTHVVMRADSAAETWTAVVNNNFVVRDLPAPINTSDSIGLTFLGKNREGEGNFMTGMLDAVGIWKRPLSDSEISQLYNSGNGIEF